MTYHLKSLATKIAIGLIVLGIAACGKQQESTKIKVAVSILPQEDFVEHIGKDLVDVTVMIPPGASPATYEPTPEQLRKLDKAKLYIRIGHIPFEKAWMNKILNANKKMRVVDSSEGIEIIGNDPHIWNSPRLVKIQVKNIYQGLAEVDPEHKEIYAKNEEAYLKELNTLDTEIRGILSGIKNRRFMVFHPSWGYFARDYGLEQIPIEIEGKEPSAADMASLIEKAKVDKIKVVFVQSQFSGQSAKVIADQIGARLISVNPLAKNYITNLRAVAQTFAQAMQ